MKLGFRLVGADPSDSEILPDFPDFPEFLKETRVSFNTFHKKQYELSVKMLYPAWHFLILTVTQLLL